MCNISALADSHFHLKPAHMSWVVGDSLLVIIQGENSQTILLMNNNQQIDMSPISVTYENQAYKNIKDNERMTWLPFHMPVS